jgi:CheY-like chemotaxis protein
LSRAEWLGRKVAVVSVSAANGAHTLAVLVVEDDFFVRYDIAGCLREAGYAVIESESGEEALAFYESGMSIDIIVTDINLGGSASGWDVAERLRSEQPDMPVIYISGELIDPERCVPGSVFVAKPYQHIDILSACRRLHNR